MNIVDFAIRKPVTITMLVLAALIFGYVSFERLAVNLLPDISYPSLTVRTEYEGAAPQEVENLISRRIEEDVGVITGLVEVSSISRAGVSDVVLEFDWDTDMNLAIMDVRERVDRVFLPEHAERPILLRYNPELDPIMRLGLSGEDLIMLRNLADWEIRRQLETVPGVASVRIKGGLVEEIQVEINEAQLTRLGLTFGQINQRLAAENINQAGGQLQEGDEELIVRAVNEFRTVGEIGEIIISSRGEAPVRLHDVATVRRHFKERKTLTRINGRESVEIALFKEADANTVTVARAIRERLGDVETGDVVEEVPGGKEEEAGKPEETAAGAGPEPAGAGPGGVVMGVETATIVSTLPEGVTLHLVSDQSRFIENAIDEVIKTAQWGGVLAILVLFLFLRNLRSTLIVGVAIPVSVLITFILMFFSETSLNIMSLGGLALGIGMLVDNAIVVLESIFRCREEGDDMVEAARRGASEVGMAVTASTLTTIAVFFPIVFIEGIAGQIFTDQALTVTFALLASLAVALTFIPMMASREGSLAGAEGRGLWVQSTWRDFRRTPAEERGGAIRWFAGRFLSDPAHWFGSTFPGLGWFGETAQRYRSRGGDRSPSAAMWIGIFPLYLAGRFFVLLGHWLRGCVRHGRAGAGDGNRWLRAAAWLPRWLLVFFFRLIMPFYRFIRFLVGSVFKILITLVPNLLLVALVPVWFVLRGIFWVLGKVFQPVLYVFNRGLEALQAAYVSLLTRVLDQRFVTLLVVAAIVGTSAVLIPRLGTELIPEMEQGEFAVDLILPTGTPLADTDETASMIESLIREDPDVKQVYVVVGAMESSGSLMDEERENVARVGVMLDVDAIRERGSDPVMDRLRHRLADIPDARVEFVRPALFSFKAPLEVEIRGFNLKELRGVSGEVVEVLGDLDGLRDVRSLMEAGYPEAVIVFDRDRMAALGVDIGQAADAIRNKVRGSVATRFSAGERKIDIRVRAREEDRTQIAQLKAMAVNTVERRNTGQNGPADRNNDGGQDPATSSIASASFSRTQQASGPIQLSAVARVHLDEGPSEIRRIDQQRVALVTAGLTGVDLGSVAGDMQERLAGMELPDDFNIDLGGQYREMTIASRSMLLAIAMAVFLVYLVMASQFESLIHPFIIMISFLLALAGVLLTLYVLEIAISVIVLIGIIMLAGIVVNNAIVLVDYINQLRRRGEDRIAAVITAGRVRLRPILMTSATTILGLLPLALGLGEGTEIRTPLAITVIAGLIASTFLTLIVIPVIYSLVDRDRHFTPAEES